MKLIAKILQLFLLLLFINVHIYRVLPANLWNSYMQVHLQKCTATCNKKYCNISSICRPVNRTSKLKSLDIYMHPGVKLESPLYVELIGLKKFRTEYRPYMMRMKEELCSFLLYKNHTLFRLGDKGLLKRIKNGDYGNFLDPCPFAGHRYLKPRITNSEDDAYHIPLIPVGEWQVLGIISKNDEQILTFSEYYEIKATGATEF